MTYIGRFGEAMPRTSDRGDLCRLEQMVAGAAVVSLPRQAMLGVLLEATLAFARGGRSVLMPLWAHEAMQRAYNLIGLVVELERQAPSDQGDPLAAIAEHRIALELANAFHSLVTGDDQAICPCSEALRTIVRDLVELFGPAVGQIRVRTSVEPLALPAVKRRALVLMACELAINALRHGFAGRRTGCITVVLGRTECGRARLRVADDGWGIGGNQNPQPGGIAFDLAALLGSEVRYHATAGGVCAEIEFPIAG